MVCWFYPDLHQNESARFQRSLAAPSTIHVFHKQENTLDQVV